LFKISLSPLMDNSPCLDLGTVPSDCGILTLEPPPEDSLDTPRTSYLLPSLLTTDKSSLDLVTEPSSCGTPLENASTPSTNKDTLNGSPVSDSHLTLKTLPSSLLVGISSSRSGTCLTASSRLTSLVTLLTSTLALFPLTVLSALLPERTEL